MKKEIDRLLSFAHRELPDHAQCETVLTVTGRSPAVWLTVRLTELDMLTEAIALLKAMQGRVRNEMRRKQT